MRRTALFLGDVVSIAAFAVLVVLALLMLWVVDLLPRHEPTYDRRTGHLRHKRPRLEEVA